MALANKTAETIENVSCAEIEVEPKFNARFSVETSTEGDDGDGQKGLVNSISTKGQDTAVILRRLPKGAKKPYFLVAGFRRFSAIMTIAQEKGDKAPTIKAVIRDMTDQEARETNMRENTARDDLSGPDLCFGIGSILGVNKGLSSVQLAQSLGMSQGYVGKLMTIWNTVRGDITKDWRANPLKLTTEQMVGIAKVDKEKQREMYDSLLKGKAEPSARGPLAWVDTAQKAAAAVGAMLGTLQRDGALEIVGDDFFGDNIRTLVQFKDSATEGQVSKIAGSAEKAYSDALEAEETEEQAKVAEGKSEGAKKASAANKKKKKGGTASAN